MYMNKTNYFKEQHLLNLLLWILGNNVPSIALRSSRPNADLQSHFVFTLINIVQQVQSFFKVKISHRNIFFARVQLKPTNQISNPST